VNQQLQGVPIFAGLEEPALELLNQRAVEATFHDGEVIVREGEPGNRLFLIGSGSVRVRKHVDSPDEIQLAVLGPKDFFGEMCILETLPRSATVESIGETTVFGLTSLTFYHLFQQMPGQYSILILNIARDLSRRLRSLDEAYAAKC